MPLSPPTPKVSPAQRVGFFFVVYGVLAALSWWLSYEMRFSGGAVLTTADKDIEGYLFTQRPHALLWVVHTAVVDTQYLRPSVAAYFG